MRVKYQLNFYFSGAGILSRDASRLKNLLANFHNQCDNLCKIGGEKIYLTQKNIIRNLTKDEYFQLREMCFFSNCLYNVALYNIRQQYFQDKTYLKCCDKVSKRRQIRL